MDEPVKTKRAGRTVAVIGNPNTGKSTLFNALTGLKQHVGNYPGVTVERKTGTAQLDDKHSVELIDLPGTYSLAARSPDEMIAVDVLINQLPGTPTIDAILAIADASNPERNFYLISQLLELGLPIVVALNMLDVAETKGISVDVEKIGKTLGVRVVGICANRGKGLDELKSELLKALDKKKPPSGPLPQFPATMNAEIDTLLADLNAQKEKLGRSINRLESFRALVDKGGHAEERLSAKLGPDFINSLEDRRKRASTAPLPAEEVRTRYAWVKSALAGAITRPAQPPATRSDGIDKWVTHWFSGSLIFVALMFIVFQAIFTLAQPVMDVIKNSFSALSDAVASNMPEGALRSLIGTGVIKGVGAVLVFLPQICLLFLFIAIMEDCGYMARAAFLMDRLLSRVGLSGKSFIPMLSSFACAVPGIMATRTIENWRDRLTTILVAPLMSCSARLPVYTLMILAFIPAQGVYFNWLGLRGVVMFAMYFVGIVVSVPVAWLLKKTLLKGETPPFLIELPSYKIPDWRGVLLRVFDRGKAFVVRAGTIILAVNIVVWALAYFPHSPEIESRYKQHREMLAISTAARIKRADLTPPTPKDAPESRNAVTLALAQSAKYDDERNLKRNEASKEPDAVKRAELEKAADIKHADNMLALSKVVGVAPYFAKIEEIRDAVRLQTVRKEAEEIDKHAETAKKRLEDESDEKKRAELEKAIDARRDAELEALSKDYLIARIWPHLAEIRAAEKEQNEGLEDLTNKEAGDYLQQSYFGRIGKFVEPAFTPLGWDWRISMAAIASFPAREVIVATLGTIFSQGEDVKAESASLQDALKKAEWDETAAAPAHKKLFNIPVALSIMVFFALCSQCAATLATIKRETNSWWWPLFSFTYMTTLAYLGAMLTYQIGMHW